MESITTLWMTILLRGGTKRGLWKPVIEILQTVVIEIVLFLASISYDTVFAVDSGGSSPLL